MEEILVDSDIFIALTNHGDASHKAVSELLPKLKSRFSFLTTNFVFAETLTLISRRFGLSLSLKVAEIIEATAVILDINTETRLNAFGIFKKQTSKNVSFTDCVNLAVSQNLGQEKIFSFDEHYAKNGLKRPGFEAKV